MSFDDTVSQKTLSDADLGELESLSEALLVVPSEVGANRVN